MVASNQSITGCRDVILALLDRSVALTLLGQLRLIKGNVSFTQTLGLLYQAVQQTPAPSQEGGAGTVADLVHHAVARAGHLGVRMKLDSSNSFRVRRGTEIYRVVVTKVEKENDNA